MEDDDDGGQGRLDWSSPYPDGLPGHSWPGHDTDIGAAVSQLPSISENCRKVLDYLREIWPAGATDFELQERLRMFSAARRRCDLKNMDLVEDSGERRPSPLGNRSAVWVVKKGPR